jgi:energy-coupling factor transporter transmembrane protein EcfT
MMLSLIVRFIPVILEQAGEVTAAQRARGVENRRNPVYRMVKFIIPLSRRIILRADHLAAAIESRGYTGQHTPPALTSGARDGIALGIVLCICGILVAWHPYA